MLITDRDNIKGTKIILATLLATGAFLRFYHIDFQSLWIDEINTMVQARPELSFRETYQALSMDLQPPLYFYVLKYLFRLFGYSTVVLRGFSAVLGVAGIFAMYLLGKEAAGKKAGVYAALILCLNSFHIHYSQEARPYTFLFLFTTLSFFWFLRFLKQPTYQTALIYGFFTSLMMYGHPYGIFSLCVQGLVLTVCMFKLEPTAKWIFFRQAFAGYLITIILYLPAIPLFLTAAAVKDFWIPAPGPTVVAHLVNDFFNGSEFLLGLVWLLILIASVRVMTANKTTDLIDDFRRGELLPVYIITILWIILGILLPYIRSYTHVPMIVSRYLMGVLPAVLLLVSFGLVMIHSYLSRLAVIFFVIFSLTDLFPVSDYYNRVNKSQLREVSSGVKDNYLSGTPIVSDLWWHYSFFLNQKSYRLMETPPATYINEMMAAPQTIKPFWYINGHHFSLDNLDQVQRNFLTENFYPAVTLNFYYASGFYFVPKKRERVVADLSEFKPHATNGKDFIFLYNLSSTRSHSIRLDKGNYRIFMTGRSEPEKPINKINAHLTVNVSGRKVGGVFLGEKAWPTSRSVAFSLREPEDITIELVYDNDLTLNGEDRNARIYSLYIEKQN